MFAIEEVCLKKKRQNSSGKKQPSYYIKHQVRGSVCTLYLFETVLNAQTRHVTEGSQKTEYTYANTTLPCHWPDLSSE